MGLVTLISNGFKAAWAVLQLITQRDREENAPAVVANVEAARAQATEDQVIHDVVSGDLEHIREDAS